MARWLTLAIGLTLVAAAVPAAAQSCPPPRVVVDTVLGMKYCSDPAFNAVIDTWVQKIRDDVRAAREAVRLVLYASTAISPGGGGMEKVSVEIAATVKARLEKTYGAGAWIIDPGVYQMP